MKPVSRTISILPTAEDGGELSNSYLDDVDPGEIASEPVQAPIGEGKLQQPKQTVEGVVDGNQLAEILEPEHGSENGEVGGVQEVAAKSPNH